MIKEQCVADVHEAIAAERNGADRLELAPNIEVGGVTPTYGLLKFLKEKVKIPLIVMIRPRGGDFFYSDEEFEIMKMDLLLCKDMGVRGVVFGILNQDLSIDLRRNRVLCELAGDMEKVFHKAFDEIPKEKMQQSLEELIQCGFDRLLTTAGKETAEAAIPELNQLIQWADNRIVIMPAGKVTYANLEKLSEKLNSQEFHGRKIVQVSQD